MEYLEWLVERGSKTRDGSNSLNNERMFNPKIFSTNDSRCPVSLFKKNITRRPSSMCTLDSPLYLLLTTE